MKCAICKAYGKLQSLNVLKLIDGKGQVVSEEPEDSRRTKGSSQGGT
jgi:DNA-binding transcriptional regulator YhcF (GntR family)